MAQSNFAEATTTNGSSMVLLARVVDRTGRPVPPWQVASIEFSVFGCGGQEPSMHLVVADVLSSRLRNDDSWSVDVTGYNFRHNFDIGDGTAMPGTGSHVELCYVFSTINNTKEIIRFHLKVA
jgi:hypothetical protein